METTKKCETCGEEMVNGQVVFGTDRKHTWDVCPYGPHEDLRVEKDIAENIKWALMLYRDGKKQIIRVCHSEKEALIVRQSLWKKGYYRERSTMGLLILPGDGKKLQNETKRASVGHRPRKKRRRRIPKQRTTGMAKKQTEDAEVKGDSATNERLQQVAKLRDENLLSWRAIGEKVGGVSPGTARRMYKQATGKSHKEAPPAIAINAKERQVSEGELSVTEPFFEEGVSAEEVQEYLEGASRVSVLYSSGQLKHFRMTKFGKVSEGKNGLIVSFTDEEGKNRTPSVSSIVALG